MLPASLGSSAALLTSPNILFGARHKGMNVVSRYLEMVGLESFERRYEPDFVAAAPGDTVTFVPTDKSHNAESIAGMLPADAKPFKSKLNEQVTINLQGEGLYGVKCTPHYGMGMVMLISVGAPTNLEEAGSVRYPPRAKQLFDELLAAVPTT
jgi:pseudoazurin